MGSASTLTLGDADAIKQRIFGVTDIAPEVSTHAQVKAGSNNTSTTITGASDNYPAVENITVAQGRFFSADEVKQRRKVTVLGPTVVANLFGQGAVATGKEIKISALTFDVIGVCAAQGATGPFDPDDMIYIPLDTAIYRLIGSAGGTTHDTLNGINVLIADTGQVDTVKREIQALLRRRHKLKPSDSNDFMVMAAADIIQSEEASNQILTLLFSSIAIVSLLVGGIGIMNIMLVSVTERTREIGLRKALGATPRDILLQFLIESLTLSLAGGLVGVACGIGTACLVRVFGLNSSVSAPWVALSFSFAAVVGIVFGLLPARKAADLNPVEALRHE
jgi:putative ABC transport system permease protein